LIFKIMSIVSPPDYKPNPWYFRRCGKKFRKVMMPIIAKTMPAIHPSEFVNIQPMKTPPTSIFYLDYVKNKKKWYQFWKK